MSIMTPAPSVPVERELAATFPDTPPSGGACSRRQPEFDTMNTQYAAFDDDPDEPQDMGVRAAAKTICGRCPVARACAEHALRACEAHGIWGGMTVGDRAARRRKTDEVTFRNRRAKAMHEAGMSANEIAEALDLHPTTIRRALRAPSTAA